MSRRGIFDDPNDDDQISVEESGPIYNPVDRFAHLPRETRTWLERLRPQDIEEIEQAREFMRSTKTITRFFKWAVITLVSIFMGTALLGEKLIWWWKWFTGGVPK